VKSSSGTVAGLSNAALEICFADAQSNRRKNLKNSVLRRAAEGHHAADPDLDPAGGLCDVYLPYGMRFASSGITQIHREIEEVAQVSGAGVGQIFRRILLPLLAPVLLASWIYALVPAVRSIGMEFGLFFVVSDC
jgi:binding-protein-dependent transport system inner membrane component